MSAGSYPGSCVAMECPFFGTVTNVTRIEIVLFSRDFRGVLSVMRGVLVLMLADALGVVVLICLEFL